VAGEVGQERFDLWFGDGVKLSWADESLLVSAADQFTVDRLRNQFRGELAAACRRLAPGAARVRFELDPSLAPSVDQALWLAPVRPPEAVEPSAPTGGCRRFASFDDFVVGGANRVALAAAQMVVERPGTVSPTFFHGPPGSGKTHLLEAIWTSVRRTARGRHVLYLTAEQFTTSFLEALRGSGLPSFRHKYRHVDLLLIDDVQFFIGKRATLVELQNTVEALQRDGRQMVLAADRSPAELTQFGPVLATRLAGGLVCELEAADRATRLEILRRRAQRLSSPVPDDVLAWMAEHLDGDARKLSGALHRLEVSHRAFHRPMDLELAQTALRDLVHGARRGVQLPDIARAVCDVFGVDPQSLQSPQKGRALSQPRALAMWLARKHTRAAYSEIGAYFGRRSHSTVISAQKQVGRWRDQQQPVHLASGSCAVDEAIRRVETQLRAG
jgi:chromosomal replication initiator protein